MTRRKQAAAAIQIEWGVDDGYVGGQRPQCSDLRMADFAADMTDLEIENVIYEVVQEDFNQRITPSITTEKMSAAVAAIRAKLKTADAA